MIRIIILCSAVALFSFATFAQENVFVHQEKEPELFRKVAEEIMDCDIKCRKIAVCTYFDDFEIEMIDLIEVARSRRDANELNLTGGVVFKVIWQDYKGSPEDLPLPSLNHIFTFYGGERGALILKCLVAFQNQEATCKASKDTQLDRLDAFVDKFMDVVPEYSSVAYVLKEKARLRVDLEIARRKAWTHFSSSVDCVPDIAAELAAIELSCSAIETEWIKKQSAQVKLRDPQMDQREAESAYLKGKDLLSQYKSATAKYYDALWWFMAVDAKTQGEELETKESTQEQQGQEDT